MSRLQLDVKTLGGRAILETMKRLAAANKDMHVPLRLCAFRMERSVAENFRAQGIPELGIQWKPPAPMTVAMRRKGRKRSSNKSRKAKALLDTGTLRNSYVRLAHPHHIRQISAHVLVFGSELNYARKQQEGFTIPGGMVRVGGFTRRKTAGKRRGKKNRVTVKAHTRTVKPRRVPARPHLAIKPHKDVRIFNKIFIEYERRTMQSAGAR